VSPEEYQSSCERTAPPTEPFRDRLLHLALGLGAEAAGELFSLVVEPVGRDQWFLSELGDCLWYATALATSLGVSLRELTGARAEGVDRKSEAHWGAVLVVATGELQESVRRQVFLEQRTDSHLVHSALLSVVRSIEMMALGRSATLEEVMELNRAKLQKRFPTT
jgi:NTP pyrophosphatase (non-canonical NTP hydrolase)